jgi:hypothetical protein
MGERPMTRNSSGLAARLADFFNFFSASNRRAAKERRTPDLGKRKLATQLLKTLSLPVLAVAGYQERRKRRGTLATREPGPVPRPVGELWHLHEDS